MGDAGDKSVNYRLNLLSNAKDVSVETTGAMLGLYDSITKGNAAIKAMQAANRALIGTDKETIGAKEDLISLIEKEKIAVGKANLALLQQGATYGKLAADAKAASVATAQSLSQVGGPLAELSGKLESVQTVLAGAKTGMGALTVGAALLAVAIVGISAALVKATISLGEWLLEGASLQKSQQLAREGFAGSAENAKHLGEQVADLASKVALPTEEINQLGIALIRTRLSGPAVVDAMNAIGQAAGGASKDVGAAVQEWITRGQMWNRFQLNPLEMQSSGIQFTDVAGQLAKNMGVGVAKAQMALRQGAVKIEDGAKALRQVVEKQFGAINAQKMLTLDNLTVTWHKHLQTLFADVDFGKLMGPLSQVMALFDSSSVSGYAMKQLVDELFGSIETTFKGATPLIQDFVEKLTIGALEAHMSFMKIDLSIRKAFGNGDLLAAFTTGLHILEGAAVLAGVALAVAAAGAVALTGMVIPGFLALVAIVDAVKIGYQLIKGMDWKYLGNMIADGLTAGLEKVVTGIANMGEAIKNQFKKTLGIHSPSSVFADYGAQTVAGYSEGVNSASPQAQAAVERMAPSAPASVAPTSQASARGPVQLTVQINVTAGSGGQDVADKLSAPSFLAQFTKAVEEMLITAGVPSQGLVTP